MPAQSIALLSLTLGLTGTVAANRFVKADGTQSVADAATFGVCRQGGVSGDNVTVDVMGTAIVEAGAAVVKGATLKADSSGRGITWVTSGAKIGLALEAATAAGQMIEVLLIPNVA